MVHWRLQENDKNNNFIENTASVLMIKVFKTALFLKTVFLTYMCGRAISLSVQIDCTYFSTIRETL